MAGRSVYKHESRAARPSPRGLAQLSSPSSQGRAFVSASVFSPRTEMPTDQGSKKFFKMDKFSTVVRSGAKVGALTVGAAAVAVYGTPLVLGAIGFGQAGVAAGSTAAWVQATYYGSTVGAGSVFAGCQSVAMGGGLSTATTAAVSAIPAVTTAIKKGFGRK